MLSSTMPAARSVAKIILVDPLGNDAWVRQNERAESFGGHPADEAAATEEHDVPERGVASPSGVEEGQALVVFGEVALPGVGRLEPRGAALGSRDRSFHPAERLLASASYDGTVVLWDYRAGRPADVQ